METQVMILKMAAIGTFVICSIVGYYSGYSEGYNKGRKRRIKENDKENQKEKETP